MTTSRNCANGTHNECSGCACNCHPTHIRASHGAHIASPTGWKLDALAQVAAGRGRFLDDQRRRDLATARAG